MKTSFESRLQQCLKRQDAEQTDSLVSEQSWQREGIFFTPMLTQSEQALLLVDISRSLKAINDAAARMLGIVPDMARGQSIDGLASGRLSAIALRPNALKATTMFEIASGHTVVATTRLLMGQEREPQGWIVILHDVGATPQEFPWESEQTLPIIDTLQHQIQTMQELITMLPQFSQNQYWRQLLMEHMEKLTTEMTIQIQQISPMSA